jgi:hypothetical protein
LLQRVIKIEQFDPSRDCYFPLIWACDNDLTGIVSTILQNQKVVPVLHSMRFAKTIEDAIKRRSWCLIKVLTNNENVVATIQTAWLWDILDREDADTKDRVFSYMYANPFLRAKLWGKMGYIPLLDDHHFTQYETQLIMDMGDFEQRLIQGAMATTHLCLRLLTRTEWCLQLPLEIRLECLVLAFGNDMYYPSGSNIGRGVFNGACVLTRKCLNLRKIINTKKTGKNREKRAKKTKIFCC